MATPKQTPTEDTQTKAVAVTGASNLPAEFLNDAMEDAGAGTSGAADDNIIPFLVLLQDMSPETKKRDPKYIEGAEPGKWLNKATGEVYDSFDFQPCAFQRVIMEWVPRDNGGGIAGRFPLTEATVEATMKAIGGVQVKDPRDKTGEKMIWQSKKGNDLIDTRYEFGHVVRADGTLLPAVMGLSSTAHTPARQFMTMKRGPNAQIPKPGGGTVVAPSWFRKYKVSSQERTANSNNWFVPKFDDYGQEGWLTDSYVRSAGKMLNQSVNSGVVQAAAENPDADAQAGGSADHRDEDLPI